MKKNKYILLILLFFFKSTIVFGQTDSPKRCDCKPDTLRVFGDPEKMPTFPGGIDKLIEFLNRNAIYPEKAVEQKIEDRVILAFCVLETGEITDIIALRGKYQILNDEAIRVVKLMPNWEPAIGNGKAVCWKYLLPVTFNLESNKRLLKEKKRHKSPLGGAGL